MGQVTYKLISSTTDLVAGEKYIIVSSQTAGSGRSAMGYQNSNNRPQSTTSVTVVAGSPVSIATTPATSTGDLTKAYEITLGGSSGAWTLYDSIYAGYLYAASSSSNYLRTSGSVANWTVSFSSGAAVLTCTTGGYSRNILQYNSSSSLFSCYSSGQTTPFLYRKAYGVTYDNNGSTGGTAPTDANTYFSGATVTVKANTGTLVKTGYTFSGWNTKADGSGTDYAASGSATLTMPSSDLTLYAKWVSACSAPTTEATTIGFSSVLTTSANIAWTNGGGTKRAVFIKQASSGTPAPVDGTTYTANTTFGSGTQIASSGWYCIYNGTGSSTSVSGLTATTTYRVMVVEYNCAAGAEKYLTTTTSGQNIDNFTTATPSSPTINISASSLTDFGTVCVGTNSTSQSYNVSGTSLTNDITVTAPAGFEVKTGAGAWSSSLTLTQSGGSVASTTIDVRFSPSSAGATGTLQVTNTSTGATQKDVDVSGTGSNGTVAVTTVSATAITTSSASSGGNTVSTTCGTITAKGVVWALTANPTTISNLGITSDGTGTSNYTSAITGLSANTLYNYRAYATNSNGVTSYGTNQTFTTLKSEPTNFPTSFTCGTTTTASIPLTWTDASGATTPDGYLIKWSSTSYAAIAAPSDGTAEANGSTTQNVAQGVGSYTVTGLSAGTTYFFKIWSYTNSGASIDYKTGSEPQTSCATLTGPCFTKDFETGNITEWTSAGGTTGGGTTAVNGSSGDYYLNLNENGEWAQLPTSNTYSSVSFNLKGSSNFSNSWTLYVQYSTDGTTWNNISGAGTIAGTSIGNSSYALQTVSIPTITTYVRLYLQRTGNSCYIGDLDAFCSTIPEIDIKGNNVSIASGSTSPSLANHTDFGSTAVAGGTVVRTFKILNTGSDTLKLTGSSPFVTISGTHASDFTLTTTPAAIILAGDSTSFQITFDPSATGLRTAAISIANNDSDENPYTFNIQGTGVNSNSSDIIADAGYSYTSNHDYTTYQAATISTTANSVGVFKFTIRDGGGAADADAFGTALTAVTFNVTNIANIRSAALFGGATQSTLISSSPTISIGAGTIAFTGLSGVNVWAADGSTKDVTLRVSYLTTVTDSQQLQYTIASATANADSSIFAAANAGGAVSSTTADINRIRVQATKLRFVQQPTNTSVSAAMSPAVTVEAVDANNNRDINYTGSVSITSTGMLTGSPVSASAVLGLATFSSLTHTAAATGRTLTATATGKTDATSSNFDITIFVFLTGDYRSASSGTWLTTGSTSTWDRFGTPNPGWNLGVTRPSTSTTDRVFIYHNIDATSIGPDKVYVRDGGKLTIKTSCTVKDTLKVESGGVLQIDANLTVGDGTAPDIFEVDSNGFVNINFRYSSPSTSIWKGTEIFHRGSNLVLQDWNAASVSLIPDNTTISTNTYNGYTAAFGNIICDFGSNLGASDDMIFLDGGVTINLAHNDLVFLSNSTSGADMRLSTTGTVTSGIGGNFIVDDAYTGTQLINMKTSGTLNFTIKGDLQLDAATTRVHSGSASGASTTLNVEGNINVTPSAVLEFNSSVSANTSATINLKGDLTVANSGLLQNSNSSNLGNLNFIGVGDGLSNATTQTIDIASTGTNENRYINFNVTSGAYVQLINRDFELGTNSGVFVNNGGVFDFGFDGTTPLNVGISGSQMGTVFQSAQGSTLKITSTEGIATTGTTNNVRTVASNRSFNQVATFHYIGKANQVTGNAITTGTTAKIIVCELSDNAKELSFTNSTGISGTTTISATGGKLDIRKGQVIESTSAYITSSSGTLYMSAGTRYLIPKGDSTAAASASDLIPRVDGSAFGYNLQGGTIELAGSGASEAFQTIRGSRTYKNLKFSGANTYLTDYKNLSSTVTIDSSLIITGSAVVDCINASSVATSFIGTAGLVMDGGRIRFKKLDDAQPELTATATLPTRTYNITGGTVEFYGSGASQNQRLRGTDGNGNTISYQHIDIKAAAANTQSGANFFNVTPTASFGVKGALTIDSPAVFRLDKTENVSGTGSFTVRSGATLLYGSPDGIKTSGTGVSDGNIRISGTRTFPTTASYGFVGNGGMVTGNGLPSAMVNMYVNKGASGDTVTLTNGAEITNKLVFKSAGVIKTKANTLYVSNAATDAIVNGAVSGTDKYVQGLLKWKTNSDSLYVFPIGDSTQNAQGFTIKPTGTNGSDILGYLEKNSSSPIKTVAYCDLETKTAPGQQIGQGTAGPDGALDQVTFNLASPLQWDVTNPGGGVSSYDITVLANGGQDISPISSAGGTAIRFLMKNGEPGNTGVTTASGGADFPTVGFIACPNGYSLSGMTSFSKFTLDGATAASTQLPVKLTYFTAKRVENRSQLNWGTSLEIDNDRFEVERSADAISFELLGTVKGAGNTTAPQTYQLYDEAPLQGWNYYRLKQVDFDSKFEYSNTVALYFDGENFSIVIYPNPAKGKFTLVSVGEANVFDAAIFNTIGQEIRKVKTGEVNSVEDLAAGHYFIKIKADNQIITKKLIIQ